MSLWSTPVVADTVARVMQAGVRAGERRLSTRSRARFPDRPGVTEQLDVPTSLGAAPTTVYRPPTEAGPPAVHVNLHGGGFVLPGGGQDDAACRLLAHEAGVVVLDVDYVLAPQHRFPAAAHQVHEVLRWVARHGEQHGWDGERLSVGGQSAGGGLAAAAARLAWEQGDPAIRLQVLHYPPLDLTVAARDKTSPRPRPLLRPWMGDVFDTAYAPDPTTRPDRLASPAGPADTTDLTGIAPAVVVAAGDDILATEAQRYARRLDDVGALAELRVVPGADHAYDMSDDALALETYGMVAGHLRRVHAR